MKNATNAFNPALASHSKPLPIDPECPFPVGVEYYRAPIPPMRFWEDDFARISTAGMHIIRTFPYWHCVEPKPGKFEFDDLDLFFELSRKHNLKVWLDITVGTHGACPEWLIREYPDMRVVRRDGRVQHTSATSATPQGAMIHNFDHPKWRYYAERYVRTMVTRYKDHPNLSVWGTWDGINFAGAWSDEEGYPPYNDYTIAKYIAWLKERFTLEHLNERLLRRYRSWEDVQPPRDNNSIVDMMLYRQFHYENMADTLGWMADLIDRIDGRHEQRSHGWFLPRQWDEIVSPRIDSWGLSMPSADTLTSNDPYSVATRCFGFQWSRAVGREGRWWTEEIYAGSRGEIHAHGKQSTSQELTTYLWLSLVEGAAGALFWQYRPEYLSFEGPGLNLVALDGEPTPRWTAVTQALGQIKAIAVHLPFKIPRPELAVAYSALSQEVFMYAGHEESFHAELIGVYRTLWKHSIPQDVVSPSMDWSKYKVVYLPNFAVLDDVAVSCLRRILQTEDGPSLITDGHFGTFAGNGRWSFRPPEGLGDMVNVRLADFNKITSRDIREGRNMLKTEYGQFAITNECHYAILEPHAGTKAVATLNGEVVAVNALGRRLSWWGLSLSTGFGGVGQSELLLPLFGSYGVGSPFSIRGDRLVVFRRMSKVGGSLVFLFNLGRTVARTTVEVNWPAGTVTDLLEKKEQEMSGRSFRVEVPPGGINVLHTADV